MKQLVWHIVPLFLVFFGILGCQAPKDYYLEFAKMERLGEEIRQDAMNVPPQVAEDPLVVAFEPGEAPSALLAFDVTSEVEQAAPSTQKPIFRAQIPIAVDEAVLKSTLERNGITVTGVRNVDGRLRSQYNVVRITFVPSAFSDEALIESYLLLLAVVRGADSTEGTVDQVIGIAEDDSANTRMVLEGRVNDYIDYVERRVLSRQTWLERVAIRRF